MILHIVMAGLVPAIHVFDFAAFKTWMPATSAGMTVQEAMLLVLLTREGISRLGPYDGLRSVDRMSVHYVAVIEKEPDSAFGVWFPDVEGCFSAGETVEEAVANAAAAFHQHVEVFESAGRSVPAARSIDDVLRDEDVTASIEAGAVLFVLQCTHVDTR
jgi:predicted RNase H-like HicB family nuclease